MEINTLIKSSIRHIKVDAMKRKGIKTNRRILVLESDDWGSIRMPSLEVASKLTSLGVQLSSPNSYDVHDTIETDSDLTCLMEVLDSVHDKNGNPAKITMNYVMGNPDFIRIEADNFKNYYYELFYKTYLRYPHCVRSFDYLKEGIRKGVFKPQFHGREHLNVPQWMRCLQSGDSSVIAGFKERVFSIKPSEKFANTNEMAAFDAEIESDCDFINQSVKEGLHLFKEVFGFVSKTMIAPCHTWDPYLEKTVGQLGVKVMQSSAVQRYSLFYSQQSGKKTLLRWMGDRNEDGMHYTIRNCSFEPAERENYGLDRCLRDIERQFKWHHPAIIASHRQNFIGELHKENRDNNLRALRVLLTTVKKQYPDVEFMSSDELADILFNE